MKVNYTIADVEIYEEKFVAENDVISTVITSSKPIKIEFDGQSMVPEVVHNLIISKNASCSHDSDNNAVHIKEGGAVKATVTENPETLVDGKLVYDGMSTVLSASRPLSDVKIVESEPGVCKYNFTFDVDQDGTTLSWAMNDEYNVALNQVKEILSDTISH